MKMPSIIVIIGMTCSIAGAEVELGVALKSGPNVTRLADEYRVDRYGLSGGLAGHSRWPLAGRFSLAGQLDLLYTPRGTEAVYDGYLQEKLRAHYLDVVVAARPQARLGPVSIYFLLGGGVNFLVSAHREGVTGWTMDITESLRRIDVALLAGAGAAFHLPRRGVGPFRLDTVFVEGRHDHGLISTYLVADGFENRSSSLLLGLSFTIDSGAPAARTAASPRRGDPRPPSTAARRAGSAPHPGH